MAQPCQEFPGVSPRTVVKTFHELVWRYLLYPWFGKYGEEEDWIFKNTQKLADQKSNRQSLSLDWQLCFLLSCFYKQTSAFMSIPPPLSAGDFQASCLVRSSLYSYYSIATCKKKPLVSREHSKAFVTIGSSIFSLTITSSSGIFKGPGYAIVHLKETQKPGWFVFSVFSQSQTYWS